MPKFSPDYLFYPYPGRKFDIKDPSCFAVPMRTFAYRGELWQWESSFLWQHFGEIINLVDSVDDGTFLKEFLNK